MSTLAEQMNAQDFDHVWTVAGGRVVDAPGEHAPEVYVSEQEDGTWPLSDPPEGWEFVTYGMTGQYGYAGPLMHASEYIGRGMAERIAEIAEDYSCFAIVCATPLPLDEEEEASPEEWVIVGKLRA